LDLRCAHGEDRFQLVEPLLGRIVCLEPGGPLQLGDERTKREAGITGKLTGNFAESGHPRRFSHLINELIQRLAAKFPTQWNREFLQP